jgi:hypothetical protein
MPQQKPLLSGCPYVLLLHLALAGLVVFVQVAEVHCLKLRKELFISERLADEVILPVHEGKTIILCGIFEWMEASFPVLSQHYRIFIPGDLSDLIYATSGWHLLQKNPCDFLHEVIDAPVGQTVIGRVIFGICFLKQEWPDIELVMLGVDAEEGG